LEAFNTYAGKGDCANVFGFSWDGKVRGTSEIARRVGDSWSITSSDFVTLGEKPKKVVDCNGFVLYKTMKQWRLKVSPWNIRIQEKCMRGVVIGMITFNVVQIPAFLSVKVNGEQRHLLGCFGVSDDNAQAIFLNIGVDDPMLKEIDHNVVKAADLNFNVRSTNPKFSATSTTRLASFEEIEARQTFSERERNMKDAEYNFELEKISREEYEEVIKQNTADIQLLMEYMNETQSIGINVNKAIQELKTTVSGIVVPKKEKTFIAKDGKFEEVVKEMSETEKMELRRLETLKKMEDEFKEKTKLITVEVINGVKMVCVPDMNAPKSKKNKIIEEEEEEI